MAMWPLSTRVKRSFISGVGSPTMTVRVMSVVPSSYCAPESMRKIWLSSSGRLLELSPDNAGRAALGPAPEIARERDVL